MRTLILDALFVYKDLPSHFENKSSIEIILDKAKANKIDRFILLQNGKITKIPEGIKNVVLKNFTLKDILLKIESEAKNSDEIIVFNAGNPLYDPIFLDKMLDTHSKYIADYTYTVGYPDGLLSAIIRKDIIKELITLVEDEKEIKRDYLFQALSKDINSFDIETILSDIDLRIFRVNLGLADIGEELITKKLFDLFAEDPNADKITDYLSRNTFELYTVPYLLTLELTNYSPVSSSYTPQVKEERSEIKIESIKKVIDSLRALNSEAHVILGGVGDPLGHLKFSEIVNYTAENGFNVIIESSLNNFDNKILTAIDNKYKDKIIFVAKQDAYFENTYKMIHPEGDFALLQENIKKLRGSGFKVYRQIVRMNENEVEIEKFVRNKEMDDLIVRKYSTYCSELTDKKVVDLSPLERIPCFHLRRELFIKADGKIKACVYSRNKDLSLGDIGSDDLVKAVSGMNELYKSNAEKKYLDFCVNCDDYYVFNF